MPYYVTTPIYYVNGEPHLGHAYTTIAADVLARHMRQRGEDVFFLTGTDEHGEPVAQEAEQLGITPRELGDRNAVRFKELAARLNVTNDFFIRTTDPEHMAKVAEVVQRIHDNGHVYAGTYEGWYCPRCADFKTEAELEDGNRCPIHKIELEHREGGQLVLPAVHLPGAARAALRRAARLRHAPEPLQRGALVHQERPARRLALARPPEVGSAGAVGRVAGDLRLDRRAPQLLHGALATPARARTSPRSSGRPTVHLIGKDILKFHAVIWPALLMAAGIEVPQKVTIHGYLLLGEHKMSKSLGNVIEPFHVADVYGPDALRFYVLREVSFGSDGEVSPEGFETRYNTELANEYGNLASRTLAMIDRYRDGVVPTARAARRAGGRVRRAASTPCARASTRSSSPPRSTRSGAGSSGSTGTCRTRSPGSSRRTTPRPSTSTRCCTRSPRACAWCRCCCTPSCPARPSACSPRSGREELVARRRARFGAVEGGAKVGELGQLFPQGRGRGAGRLRRER